MEGNRTVVLVHGAWMTPASWDRFKGRFESAGFEVLAPTWPYMDRPIEELREHPHKDFGSLTVGKIADHYEQIIRGLPEPPLLVGHSFGGLITQLLLDRGVGVAGVIIDPAPIAGVIADPVSLAAALPPIARFGGWRKPHMMSKKTFDAKFANTAPKKMRDEEYDRLVVPAPGRIFYQAATGIGTRVNTSKRKQPLLVISGTKDKTAAPPLIRSIYRKQKRSPAKTEFKSFAGMSHFLIAEPGWEKVADTAIDWSKGVMPGAI